MFHFEYLFIYAVQSESKLSSSTVHNTYEPKQYDNLRI